MIKLRIILLTCAILVFCSVQTFAETVFYTTQKDCTMKGTWKESDKMTYAVNAYVAPSGAGNEMSWKCSSSGPVRLYYWITIDEIDGAENAYIKYSAEGHKNTYKINMKRGYSGWRELGFATIGPAGGTVTLSGEDGILYGGALKLESLGEEYNALIDLCESSSNCIVLAQDAPNVYINGVRYGSQGYKDTDTSALIPLRLVGEGLGAEVVWTEDYTLVKFGGHIITINVKSGEYLYDGDVVDFPDAPEYIDSKLMVSADLFRYIDNTDVLSGLDGLVIIGNNLNYDVEKDASILNNVKQALRNEKGVN